MAEVAAILAEAQAALDAAVREDAVRWIKQREAMIAEMTRQMEAASADMRDRHEAVLQKLSSQLQGSLGPRGTLAASNAAAHAQQQSPKASAPALADSGAHGNGKTAEAAKEAPASHHDPPAKKPKGANKKKGKADFLSLDDGVEATGLMAIVNDHRFDWAIMVAVVIGIIVIAIEVQYNGTDLGYQLGYGEITTSPVLTMPALESCFRAVDFILGTIFTVEIVLKLAAFKKDFFKHPLHYLESAIVVYWLIEVLTGDSVSLGINPFFLRIFRMFKVMRLLRLGVAVERFEALFILTESILASKAILFWASAMLLIIMMMLGIFLHYALVPYMEDVSISMEKRQNLFQKFGTFSRVMVTMVEITLGNFVPTCRLLQEISEYYGTIIIFYKFTVGFGAIRIISGVFMAETVAVIANNDFIMVMQKERKKRATQEKMHKLFKAADASGDGLVCLPEFLRVMESPTVRTWLAAQELEIQDPKGFFEDMGGDDGTISAEDMMTKVLRLKGSARQIDLMDITDRVAELQSSIKAIETSLRSLPRVSFSVADSPGSPEGVDMVAV